MLIGVFTFLLLAAIAYAHLNEGIYGALIVLVLSVVAGVIALNFYGPLAYFLIEQWAALRHYAEGLIFLILYGGTLLGLRVLFDKFLRERVRFRQAADRVGAVLISLVTGILTVGAFSLACQMMPLKKNFLGYTLEGSFLGIQPDAVFLNLMHHTSSHVLDTSDQDEAHLPPADEIRKHYYDRRRD